MPSASCARAVKVTVSPATGELGEYVIDAVGGAAGADAASASAAVAPAAAMSASARRRSGNACHGIRRIIGDANPRLRRRQLGQACGARVPGITQRSTRAGLLPRRIRMRVYLPIRRPDVTRISSRAPAA